MLTTNRFAPGLRRPLEFCLLGVVLAGIPGAWAVDKSGVSPTTISLPSGPGSIEGLGSDYQPQLNTGTGGYSFPLNMPSGTGGHTPEVAFVYEGGNGNGPLGIGWSVGTPSVRRQCDKGIPRYEPNGRDDDYDGLTDEADEEDRFLDPAGEELVLTDRGYYFQENISSFVRWWREGDYWKARLPSGSLQYYGTSEQSRVGSDGKVFCWLLDRHVDTNGNTIEYTYAGFPGSENRKYLREIRYGPGSPPWDAFYFAAFTYEDRPDWFEDYRSGFLIRTAKRLKQVDIGFQGISVEGHLAGDFNGDGTADVLARRYLLAYLTDEYWSLLSSITLIGADGVSALPPARFGYAFQTIPRVTSAAAAVLGVESEPSQVVDNEYIDFLDVNADGLPDIFRADGGGLGHTAWLNLGVHDSLSGPVIRWSAQQQIANAPTGDAWTCILGRSDVHLADQDGDGLADLVRNPLGGDPFYFRNLGTLGWAGRQDVSVRLAGTNPPAPFGDNKVRTLDVDFDKRIDIVRSDETGYIVWYMLGRDSAGGAWYSPQVLTPGPVDPLSGGVEILFERPGSDLADMNGDRLLDAAWIRPDRVIWYPSMGYGEFAERVETLIPPDDGFGHDSGFSTLTDEEISRAALRDVNGDGLSDLVVARSGSGELWFWINRGNHTLTQRYVITDLPPTFSQQVETRWTDLNGNGTDDLVYADSELPSGQKLRILDVGVLAAGSPNPNLLNRIENGIGGTTRLEYRPSTEYAVEDYLAGNPWPDPMPNPVNVVSRMVVSDGLGHDYLTEFIYHDGYYDGMEREFRGFARAEQIEVGDLWQPTLVNDCHFDVGEPEESLKGKMLRTVRRTEQGEVFDEEENTWSVRELFTVFPTPDDPLAPSSVSFAYLARKLTVIREEPTGVTDAATLEQEYAYDDYGNAVRHSNYGRVDGLNRAFGNDERTTWMVYSATPEGAIWDLPIENVLTDDSEPLKIVAYSRSYYDGPDFAGLPLGRLDRGNLVRASRWVGPLNSPPPPSPLPEPPSRFLRVTERSDRSLLLTVEDATGTEIEEGVDHWIDADRRRFDEFGNIVVSADPLAVIVAGVPDGGTGHYREVRYDPSLRTYPVEERIALGGGRFLVMSAAYDAAFGTMTDAWDFNGNRTRYAYDPFGRLTGIARPGGTPPDSLDMPTTEYAYAILSPVSIGAGSRTVNWIETRVHEEYGNPDAYFVSRVFVDGFGRTVLDKEEGEIPGKAVVTEAYTFNARKTVCQNILPYFSCLGMQFENPEDPAWTGEWIVEAEIYVADLARAPSVRTVYDAIGRQTRVVQPDGSESRIQYFPRARLISDGEDVLPESEHFGTPRIERFDGLDRLIALEEVVGLNDDGTPRVDRVTWTTTYEYDLLDNLTALVDSQNNRRIYKYDALKRKIYADDVDTGRTRYTYDDASNLVEIVDAKQQSTTYTYDGANRILTEDYHDEDEPFSMAWKYDRSRPVDEGNRPDVAYFYDEAAGSISTGDGNVRTATQTAGFLSYVWDTSGEEHQSFDERGRIVWTAKRIVDFDGGPVISYTTEYEYDPLDRLTRLIYPDGDSIVYRYNSRRLLDSIVGGPNSFLIDSMEYLPTGQVRGYRFGNGVRTRVDHDIRLRVDRIHTFRDGIPDRPLIDYAYTYDAASNIEGIEDLRSPVDVPAGDARRNNQSFSYDDLYRLTRVAYSFALPGQPVRDDGDVEYLFDRIGNMISKTSSFHRSDEVGMELLDLGTLGYGGAEGSWNRQGRAPDEISPHALRTVSDGRTCDYDANGNITAIDRRTNVWDFENRLVEVRGYGKRSRHWYDHENRRVLRKIWEQSNGKVGSASSATTIRYVNRYFEVREFDQPVKYVWADSLCVARITGTLDFTAARIQKIALHPGWNLVSIGVSDEIAATRLGIGTDPRILSVYRWRSDSGDYVEVKPGDRLPPGTILWIRAGEAVVIDLVGHYSQPTELNVREGWTLLASPALESLPLEEFLDVSESEAWFFDATAGSWRAWLREPFGFLSSLSEFLPAGGALVVRAASPVSIVPSTPAEHFHYYHRDLLNSADVITDGSGNIVEEAAYFPFGLPRYEDVRQAVPEAYKYAGKERDGESGLLYLGARYYSPTLCRFVSPDPLSDIKVIRNNAQHCNLYSYTANNPVASIDPTGRWGRTMVDGLPAWEVNNTGPPGKEDWVSKLTDMLFGDTEGYKYKLLPTQQTMDKYGVKDIKDFNWDHIEMGDTFVEVGVLLDAELQYIPPEVPEEISPENKLLNYILSPEYNKNKPPFEKGGWGKALELFNKYAGPIATFTGKGVMPLIGQSPTIMKEYDPTHPLESFKWRQEERSRNLGKAERKELILTAPSITLPYNWQL